MDSSSSSLPPPRRHWKYDVFLSFRGEDTRNNFTAHLYAALIQKGIVAFRDGEKLEKGEAIEPELLKAIEDSMFSVVVFSKNYASSGWCLDELAKIIECWDTRGQRVLPVFYHVDPSDVRKQKGHFEKDFAKHQENLRQNAEKVEKWRMAMTAAANLTGWDIRDRSEPEVINEIVEKIFDISNRICSKVREDLVGIHSHLVKLHTLLDKGSDNVHVLGIHGLGGIGKTTIAEVIFDGICDKFEASCFLANVREVSGQVDGLVLLQKRLICGLLHLEDISVSNTHEGIKIIRSKVCHKRVLVILDDVNGIDQLGALFGEKNWFGSGSRIIITTRDKHLLETHGVDEFYSMEVLNNEDSLQLFCSKAFKGPCPDEIFSNLSEKILKYASGLPLALKVLGNILYGRSVDDWTSALSGLHKVSGKGILDKLEISYHGLNEDEKEIFLDVACFFKGMERRFATEVLKSCGFSAAIGISDLIDKSLITIVGENKLWMHDLLQEMGRNVVRKESLHEPGKRSRLWTDEDAKNMLKKNTATDAVRVISYDGLKDKLEEVSPDAFIKMDRLRLLRIRDVQLPYGLHFLSNELRLLEWHAYPWKCLPSRFQPDEIVALEMPWSHIQQLWSGSRNLDKLTSLNLSHSTFLKRIPDLTGAPNLEELILEGCTSLNEVHPSIGLLKQLLTLNMKDCSCLWRLPDSIEMESLRVFNLAGCSKLKKFPRINGKMHNLSKLFLDGTAIDQLPSSIGNLMGLDTLNLNNCKNLKSLPNSICGAKSLRFLRLSSCQKLDKLPEDLGDLVALEELDAGGTAIEQLPPSIVHLTSLVAMNLSNCKNLKSLPDGICVLKSLKTLRVDGCQKLDKLPESLGCLDSMEELDLGETAIKELPPSIVLLTNLKSLSLRGWGGQPSRSSVSLLNFLFTKKSSDSMSLCLPHLSGLSSLTLLDLSDCNLKEGMVSSEISCLASLKELNLSGSNVVSLPEGISRLSELKYLDLVSCKQLKHLPELPPSIEAVKAEDCTSLETILNPLSQKTSRFSTFDFSNCHRLVDSNRGSNLALPWLKAFPQGLPRPGEVFEMVLPGSEIPEWFNYQSTGSSVWVDIPPQLSNDSSFFDFAICAVFRFHRSPSFASASGFLRENEYDFFGPTGCALVINDMFLFSARFLLVSAPRRTKIGSDHVWFLYAPAANDGRFWRAPLKDGKIKFSFEKDENGPWIIDIKKCGAYLVCNQDVEKLNQTSMKAGGAAVFEDLEEDQSHCSEELAGIEIPVTKRRSPEAFYDAAEPGGSTSNPFNEEEPQLKRLKKQP